MSTSKKINLRMLPMVALVLATHSVGKAQTIGEVTTTTAVGQTIDSATSSTLPIGTILNKAQQAAATIQSGNSQTEALLRETEALAAPTPEQQVQLDEGRSFLDQKQYKDAQQSFESAVALNYRNYDAHFGLGLALLGQSDWVGARFEFNLLTQIMPSRLEGFYNLGVVLTRLGETSLAIAAFSEAAKVGKGRVLPEVMDVTYRSLATLQMSQRLYADAAKTLGEALNLQPGNAALSLALAEALYQSNQKADKANPTQVNSALGYAYSVLAKDPANAQALALVADIYVSQGLSARGLRELDRGLALTLSDEHRSMLLAKKGELLVRQNDKSGALKVFEEATQRNPKNASAQYQLGKLALDAKMVDKALVALTAARELNPNSLEATLGLALALDAKGNFTEAYKMALASTKLTSDPSYVSTANLIAGKNAYRNKQYAVSEKLLQNMTTPEGLLWLGLSRYALKEYASAATAFESAVKLAPENPMVLSNLGASYLALQRYGEAQTVLDALVKMAPKNAEAWYNLGWARRGLGLESESQSAFRQSAALGYAAAQKELKGK